MPIPRPTTRRLAAAIALTLVVSACGGGSAEPGDAAPGAPAASSTVPQSVDDSVVAVADPAPATTEAKQRCIDTTLTMERRIAEEGYEFPDEGPELSEEDLENILIPAIDVLDDVQDPEARPEIAPMPAFDVNTSPIPELDDFVGICFELGIITDADVWGEDAEDEGGDEEWCAELATLPIDEIRVFAEEEGQDVVLEEFEYCGLEAPPLDS